MKRVVSFVAAFVLAAALSHAQGVEAVATDNGTAYLRGAIYTGLTSFDGLLGAQREKQVQASIVGRVPLGDEFSFAFRVDSLPQSAEVPFFEAGTWYAATVGSSFAWTAKNGYRYGFGVHVSGALTYALSDTMEEFGRDLDVRPKIAFAGPYVRDRQTGSYARIGLGWDENVKSDGLSFIATGEALLPGGAVLRVDLEVPLSKKVSGNSVPYASRATILFGVPVFSKGS